MAARATQHGNAIGASLASPPAIPARQPQFPETSAAALPLAAAEDCGSLICSNSAERSSAVIGCTVIDNAPFSTVTFVSRTGTAFDFSVCTKITAGLG